MIVQICKTLVYLKKPPNPNFLQLQYSAETSIFTQNSYKSSQCIVPYKEARKFGFCFGILEGKWFLKNPFGSSFEQHWWPTGHSAYNRILPSILVLKDILGSVYCVVKLLKVSVWFLKYDLEKTLLPNIEFLKSCGIGMDQLIRHIFLSPRTFLRRIEKLKKDVQKVDELKFDKNSKTYLYAVTTVSWLSDET
ncbi:hypothetical protein LIER_13243 [Lithospermum erythrorhizon]|uniref:Uncharacterized protein n=1 Tax=Lithospermum erythrorhizon TaxID=34254 RepID=A0AAV3PX94_LITER